MDMLCLLLRGVEVVRQGFLVLGSAAASECLGMAMTESGNPTAVYGLISQKPQSDSHVRPHTTKTQSDSRIRLHIARHNPIIIYSLIGVRVTARSGAFLSHHRQ